MVRPMISSEFLEDELPDDFSNQKNIILNKFLNTNKQEKSKISPARVKELISQGDEGLALHIFWSQLEFSSDSLEIIDILSKHGLSEYNWVVREWFRRLSESEPENIAILPYLLDYHILEGNFEEAEILAEKIMVSDIDDVQVYFLVIKIYQAKKNYAGIVEACEAIIRIQPENVKAIKHLSEAKNFLSSPDALDVLGKYLEIAEFNEEEWFRAARKFYNIGSYETVISLLSQMDGKTVGMENVRELRARSFYSMGMWRKCFDESADIVTDYPENMVGLRLKMRSAKKLGDEDGLFQTSKEMYEVMGDDIESLRNLIQASAARSEWAAVEDLASLGMENDAIRDESTRWMARSLSRQERDGALEIWQNLLSQIGPDREAFREIGKLHYNQFRNEEAASYFQKALEMDPDNIGLIRSLASSKIRTGKLLDALPYLERLCELNSESVRDWESLLETKIRMDDQQSINSKWSEIIEKSWDSEEMFLVGLEVALRFHWRRRFEWLINSRPHHMGEPGIKTKISRIFLNVGDIATSWRYLCESDHGDFSGEIEQSIDEILRITSTTKDELESYSEKNMPLWITSLAIREIIRLNPESRKVSGSPVRVSLASSTMNRGGAERQLSYTFNGLDRKRYSPELVVQRIDGRGNGETYESIIDGDITELTKIYSKNESNLVEKVEVMSSLIGLLPRTTSEPMMRYLGHFVKTEPDIIHCWQDQTMIAAGLAAVVSGTPFILGSARSMRPDEKTELHIRKRPHLKQSLSHFIEDSRFTLSTNSEAGRKSYADWLGYSVDEIKMVHNGVDFRRMEKSKRTTVFEERFSKYRIGDKHKVVGGVFRLEPGKRAELWLDSIDRALAHDSGIRGLIVGGGRMERTIERWINEKRLHRRVHLVGEVEDVASWLEKMDVFLLTSSTEGLPNVVIEAQGFGVPVVSTNVGGVGEIVESGETGIIVDSDIPERLAEAIVHALERREEWGPFSRKRSRNMFSVESMIQTTEELYQGILDSK